MQTAPSPVIEFRVAGFKPSQHTFDFVGRLLALATTTMGIAPGDIRKVVIADNENYGPAIRGFDPDGGYTNDSIYRGVGKTVPECSNGSFLGSNLVFNQFLLGCFAPAPDGESRAGELEAACYGFFHEIGHCVDNRRRPAQHSPSAPLTTRSHLVRCATLNSASLLDEYAACFFSAAHMSVAGFAYFAESTRGNLESYLGTSAAQRTKYRIGLATLDSVRDAALDAFWRALIEYAKMYALHHGNPSLGPGLPVWPNESPDTAKLLQDFADGLRLAWNRYPDCLPEFERLVTNTWFALTAAEGYVFEARPQGDHLHLV